MVKQGILTLDQAMVLLKEADRAEPSGENGEDDRKRGRQVLTPSKDSEMASPAPKEAKGGMDSLATVTFSNKYKCWNKSHAYIVYTNPMQKINIIVNVKVAYGLIRSYGFIIFPIQMLN